MMKTARFRRFGILAAVLVVLADLVLPACAAGGASTTISVLGIWTGDEATAFQAVLKGFMDDNPGITVNYTGTRALDQVLLTDVQKGQPPDIAVLPSPGDLAGYVRDQEVQPLDGSLGARPGDSYSAQWLRLLQVGTGKLYAVPVKADLKSIIWYDPAKFGHPAPTTWAQLTAASDDLRARGQAPWCVGLSATPASGWPGTDWIEDILLHQGDPAVYERWAAGLQPWTSDEVKKAWTTWGALMTAPGSVRGGPTSALLTEYSDAGKAMFTNPPGCSLEHQASFNVGEYRGFTASAGKPPQPGTGFDFFPFPSLEPGTPVAAPPNEVSADLAAMFQPGENARKLMAYLAGDKGQAVWPARGSAFSADKTLLDKDVYRDPVSTKIARTLSVSSLCFDASDLMPAKMSDAFNRAVLDYLADPSRLDALLANLDKVRTGIDRKDWLNVPCGG